MSAQTPIHTGHFVKPRNALIVGAIALVTLGVAILIPSQLLSADSLVFFVVAACFSGAIGSALAISRARPLFPDRTFLLPALIIWVFVMISEGIFVHLGTTSAAVAGDFGAGAYQQAASWILAMLALLFITSRNPHYLLELFSGQFKWISFYALIALGSVAISVSPLYSLAWAFKLVLIVLLSRAIASSLKRIEDVILLLQVLLAGTLGVTAMRFLTPFMEPGPAFKGGRLELVAGLSGTAGLLVILAMINLKFKKNPWLVLIAVFGVVAMILAGGKAGIAASVLAVVAFFLLTQRLRYAVIALIVLAFILAVFVAVTPIGQYLKHYSQSGEATTLTGRTDLWAVVLPQIAAHPVIGHGYLASRFLSVEVEGVFPEAGQTHNSLLESLYNLGIPGALMIVIILCVIVRNLVFVLRHNSDSIARYIAAGALAMEVSMLVWGMFTATPFGGLPNAVFMIFLTIFVVSSFLRRMEPPDSVANART
jgi:O-antigen ligase